MKNIHVLPTDKPSRIRIGNNGNFVIGLAQNATVSKNDSYTNQNIYITSDEEIKEGDIIFETDTNLVNIASKNYQLNDTDFKIILTTDQDLIKNGVQAIDDEFLEWFVKNPSCEEVEVKSEILYEHKDTYRPYPSECKNLTKTKVNYYLSIIPKEELKTSEEWQKQFPNTKVIDPDGWDRKNYQYSWFEEKITLIEYTSRLHRSTVKGIIPKEEPNYNMKQEILAEMERLEDELKSQKQPYTYSRDQVHELMCKAFQAGYKKHDVVEAGLEHLDTEVECSWILTRFDSTPK